MKKITLLCMFVLPLLGMAQVITNGTFDTTLDGWVVQNGATITQTGTEGADALGAMQIDAAAAINSGAKSSPNTSPAVAGDYLLSFKVKGTAGDKIQGDIFQGAFAGGAQYTIQNTGVWEEYTHIFNGLTTDPLNVRVIGKTASATYLIDDVSFVKVTTGTQDTFITNPDFETGDLTGWSVVGPDITAGVVTDAGTNGTEVVQIDFVQDQTNVNNYIENAEFDFGSTVNTSLVSISFDAFTTNANINFQAAIRTYDASGALVENLFTGLETISANTWATVNLSKPVTQPFNKIIIRIRLQGGGLMGNKVAVDNVSSEFDFYTLSSKSKRSNTIEFGLYPNPAKDILKIKSLNGISKLSVYDVTGKQVLVADKVYGDKIDISNLTTGIYVLQIEDNDKNTGTKKFVITK
ncbi:Por secretion system C-terminal sorting domain-containing protein [Hyunsoonleella jejuensis]|uniref:Por secretion system C-terminal sorting domain-containing protein n=1 Tax=Hyunsoonleella jejuensis TaxID=419940 RepID=A0A1H9DLT1_9FLAO|nr:T9SS type A sorting domain-containing protein [Hyunsoonleella jejuensis]SEQ14424.1 Por secretion system C-terminal sorting domain-containing protein [Hyunsoonleella jejuensis]